MKPAGLAVIAGAALAALVLTRPRPAPPAVKVLGVARYRPWLPTLPDNIALPPPRERDVWPLTFRLPRG